MRVDDSKHTWREYREQGRRMYALAYRAADPEVAKAYLQLAAGYLALARTVAERAKREESNDFSPDGWVEETVNVLIWLH